MTVNPSLGERERESLGLRIAKKVNLKLDRNAKSGTPIVLGQHLAQFNTIHVPTFILDTHSLLMRKVPAKSKVLALTPMASPQSKFSANRKRKPAFEIVVLGSGGGPLETDCSGYLLKPIHAKWEDGAIGLEGGTS